jgi:hypothetical protein
MINQYSGAFICLPNVIILKLQGTKAKSRMKINQHNDFKLGELSK